MQATLDNKRKVVAKFPKNFLKRKNRIEKSGTSRLGVKNKQEST
jgi:hypothetical protein